jgi:hypothetical protein
LLFKRGEDIKGCKKLQYYYVKTKIPSLLNQGQLLFITNENRTTWDTNIDYKLAKVKEESKIRLFLTVLVTEMGGK